jgi:hypothetical protein
MPFKKKIDVDALKGRVTNWNNTQQIKKHELGLLPNIWSSQNIGLYRQRFYALQGMETGLDQISREQIVRLSRELFFQLPVIGVASEMKAEYVVGDHWDFKYMGSNPVWGAKAEKFINEEWFSNCSTRGFAYDFQTVLRVLSRTLDMDGDVLMLFVRDKNNWPLLQFIGSHRVGTAAANMAGKDGVTVHYAGRDYKCLDGVVYDDFNKPIAYSVKKDDAQVSTVPPDPKVPSKDLIIPASNAQLIFNPLVFDKGRGLPSLYSSVLYGLQMSDLDNFLMDIAKLEATIAYVIKNDMGQAPQEYENLLDQIQAAGADSNLGSIPSLEPTVHGVSVVKGPTVNYIKADGGELESFRSDRPSAEIQAYQRAIETKLLSAIGIPHQMIYSPETISGRAVNAVTSMVNQSVTERQKVMKKYAKLAVAWALAVAQEEGILPKNYEEDVSKVVDFNMPPQFRLDSNTDNKTNLELYKVGLMSGEQFCAENNQNFVETSEKRNTEIETLLTQVEQAKAKHPTISETTIINLFTQRGTSTAQLQDELPPTPKTNTQPNI